MVTIDNLRDRADAPLGRWPGALIVIAVAALLAFAIYWTGTRIVWRIARPYPVTSVLLRHIDKPALGVLIVLALEFTFWQAPDTLRFIVTDTADNLRARRSQDAGSDEAIKWLQPIGHRSGRSELDRTDGAVSGAA
ncbi:hypothetical protein [Paraburkholderia sp. GAS42]|jgi:hypothetical protein|uniref:hypothetical protein n=1 Tax=Paraburkholderia sp. GAS42 TaxID=3035135 RepID=UPI003D249558